MPCELSSGYWVEKLNYICKYHRTPSTQNQTIETLAFLGIAKVDESASMFAVPPMANDQLCWTMLQPLLPYFPGGNGPCTFDHVYVGTLSLPSPPGMNQYVDAMANSSYRENMRLRAKTVAQQFAANASKVAPNVKWDWYISHEYSFEFAVYNPGTSDGYADYISKSMIDMQAILPNRQYFWSPAFAYNAYIYSDDPTNTATYPTLKTITDYAKSLFSTIQRNVAPYIPACSSATTCPFQLGPQDIVGSYGSSALNITRESAAQWHKRLRAVYPFQNLSMNVEHFIHNWWRDPNNAKADAYFYPDCLELKAREAYYASQGIPIGPSFALQGWYSCNHPEDGSYCDAGWTKYNQYCYQKLHWGVNWTQADVQCRSVNASLASIHSKAENDFVVALDNKGEDSIWFGLAEPFHYYCPQYCGTIRNGSALFQWTDGTQREYDNWTPGSPSPATIGADASCRSWAQFTDTMCFPSTDLTQNFKCGAIYPLNGGGQWANAGCSWYAGAFVCKKRPYNVVLS